MSLESPLTIGLDDKKEHQGLSPGHMGSLGSNTDEVEDSGRALSSSDGGYNLPPQLVQRYVKVPFGSRLSVLLSVLKNLFEREADQKVVVFFSTCDVVDFHYSLLSEFLWPPDSEAASREQFLTCKNFRLHGNTKQEDRRSTFQDFKTTKSALLLSTDISARGLDFPNVRSIIHYDSPGEAHEYLHRFSCEAKGCEKCSFLPFNS